MNPHCVCSGPGLCPRHQILKNQRQYELCSGSAETNDCGAKYWNAWENGRHGATTPADPIILSNLCPEAPTRGFGDAIHKTIVKATRGAVSGCSGCGNRAAKLNHLLPSGNLPPVVHHDFDLSRLTRHLLYFIYPAKSSFDPSPWRWNLLQLAKRSHLFNGRQHFAVAVDKNTESFPVVTTEILSHFPSATVTEYANKPKLREVVSWPSLLGRLAPNTDNPGTRGCPDVWPGQADYYPSPDEITFCAHAKGGRHSIPPGSEDTSTVYAWSRIMYETCLDYPELVLANLTDYAMTGSFKRYGSFTTPRNYRWHYSGTFYWFRNADVYKRNWRYIDRKFFGTESWPGHMFKPEETSCLFLDGCKDLYEFDYWKQEVEPQYEQWKLNHATRYPIPI